MYYLYYSTFQKVNRIEIITNNKLYLSIQRDKSKIQH